MYITYHLHEKINDLHEKIEIFGVFDSLGHRVLYKIRES